jgi:hypothetical protein
MRALALAILFLVPGTALALDCTPFRSWNCAQASFFDVMDGQPGEVICGVDYTGWTLHVVEMTTAQAGWVQFAGVSALGSGVHVNTVIILMDDCAAGTCVTSAQGLSMAELGVCLEAGTHTFVVASQTAAPGAIMNISAACLTCAQTEAYGLSCPACQVVGNEDAAWGTLKTHYR